MRQEPFYNRVIPEIFKIMIVFSKKMIFVFYLILYFYFPSIHQYFCNFFGIFSKTETTELYVAHFLVSVKLDEMFVSHRIHEQQ